ncbi:MAG: ATP-binding protein [Candidatus Kapabacteria bacterium]|nr:ATP-binding protein [Candidatus Kapabacteria bacterium]
MSFPEKSLDPNVIRAFDWLRKSIERRLKGNADSTRDDVFDPFEVPADNGYLSRFVDEYSPTHMELAVFLLALIPHLIPEFLDEVIHRMYPEGGDANAVGGIRTGQSRFILPTAQTAVFVVCGRDFSDRASLMKLFSADHWFRKMHILWLQDVEYGESHMNSRLLVNPDIVDTMILGRAAPPRFSSDFPAEHVTTDLEWSDLVLRASTSSQIQEVLNWMEHNETAMRQWGMSARVKPGYRALFFGPPGTGKTLTAMLLGKYSNREVFRVDLSRIVSKYIGETEKNLSRLFDRAENKNWILFFDEADALFSKRTDVRDAHDKYANQEVAYLLQRIEAYNGLVVLATNQRNNIDEAFVRRFQSVIHFPMPGADERLQLWQRSIPKAVTLDIPLSLSDVAQQYELSGASIMNIVHYCAIELLASNESVLTSELLNSAIRRELVKEGKVV